MDPRSYPGQGLSLSQLIFALNEELKCTAYSPSVTFDQVSQFYQDASTAVATILEWKNYFVPMGCIPSEVLALIPAHLPSHHDRLRSSFVCRHWRRSFLQTPGLWHELILSNGKDYVKTFLERAKLSPLDISAHHDDPVGVWTLLSPYTEQIRRLNFVCKEWLDVQRFAHAVSGPLPLLHTLTIDDPGEEYPDPNTSARLPLPLFSNALNLRVFRLCSESEWSPPLGHFVFPNLVSFDFSAEPEQKFHLSQLLDFLEASPVLQTVHIKISADILSETIPGERVAVLPNVETFTLIMDGSGRASRLGYTIAAHLLCPSVRSTSFVHMGDSGCEHPPEEIFPDSNEWGAIVPQYTSNSIEEIELKISPFFPFAGRLVFRSTDESTIGLYFKTNVKEGTQRRFELPSQRMHEKVFTRAVETIRDHPQRKTIKRLKISHSFRAHTSARVSHMTNEVRRLFASLGSLDRLTINKCDLQPYLDLCEPHGEIKEPMVFPPVKVLEILDPIILTDEQRLATVELVKSQHALGRPFRRVVIRHRADEPLEMGEGLRQWVVGVEDGCD